MTSSLPRSAVTRQDRAIHDTTWITEFLSRMPQAVVATALENQPFVSTVLFVYDPAQHAIIFHTSRRGRLWKNVQINPQICLTVSEMGRLLPADTALNFSVEYSSVVVFGTVKVLEDPLEAQPALQRLMDKYFPHLRPGRDYRPITPGELEITAVYRMEIEEWSAKQKAVAGDPPGAFYYGNRDK